jgi:hypothetical protein
MRPKGERARKESLPMPMGKAKRKTIFSGVTSGSSGFLHREEIMSKCDASQRQMEFKRKSRNSERYYMSICFEGECSVKSGGYPD